MENPLFQVPTPILTPKFEQKTQPCHNFIQDLTTGMIVCNECGLVKEERLISPRWSRKREFPQNGFRKKLRNAHAKPNSQLRRALKLNTHIKWDSKRVYIGEKEIKRLISIFELNNTIENRAKYLFQKAMKLQCFEKRYIRLIASVCVYYACKQNQFPVKLEELIEDHHYNPTLALKYYSTLIQRLHLPYPQQSPFTLLTKICNELGLDYEIILDAQQILEAYLEHKFTGGYQNRGIVAGVIYITCLMNHIPRSQQEVAEVAEVSQITLRSRYREIQRICRKKQIYLY